MKRFTPQKNIFKTCLVSSILILSLVGCDDDEDSSGEGYIKLYNASADSPYIYLTVDEDLSTESDDGDHYESTYSAIAYGAAHSNISLTNQAYEYQLAWQDEDSSDVDDLEVIHEGNITIAEDTIHMVVLSNSILTPEVTVYDIPVIDDDDDSTNDLFNLRILNMHSDQQAVDFYLSGDNESFNEAVLIGQYSFQELSDNNKVDQDDYIFYITAAGSEEVLFKSSSIPFYYTSQNIIIVRDNQGAGSSPYVLDKMSDTLVIEYADAESEAQFSVYNGVANHDELPSYQEDIAFHINGISDTPIIASIPFGEISTPLVLDSGDYSLDITTVGDNAPLLSNHLLSVTENTNKTVFFYAEEEYVDDDNDGNIDENDDGIIDEIDVSLFTLVIDNSLSNSIYTHEIEIVNLIQSDDFYAVEVYFVRQDEAIGSALYNGTVNYKNSTGIYLPNNTYQVFVVAKVNSSSILLNSFELILDEESTEQFLVLETSDDAPTGYKTTLIDQTTEAETETDSTESE